MLKFYKYMSWFLCVWSFSGCSTLVENKGYLIQSFDLSEIKIGVDTKQTVTQLYGEPSTTSIFNKPGDSERWYYVCRVVIESPMKGKKSLSHNSVLITFNPQGIVSGKKLITGENQISINPQTTKNAGYKTTFLKETFRNIGKFAQSGSQHGCR